MSCPAEPQDVASQLFNKFCDSSDLQDILNAFQTLRTELHLDVAQSDFYTQLKSKLSNWKSRSLWEILDKRVDCPVYEGGMACGGAKVLVVGAGPCGLRFAVEAALLGASRVVVVEKRRGYTRNNVLHLWPYLITDLRGLGAKKFYGKFCAGSLDHISIRRLQCLLLKVSLLLGVEVYTGVQYNDIVEPAGGHGWRASFQPSISSISDFDFDVVIGADGRKSSLLKRGFKQKEFRAQLAIAITANFVHGNTTAEASVPEISGVAYIYHQDFFKKLSEQFGIDLENIVYYKDETHYFVMTAKRHSLLNKGVLKKDYSDAVQLVASSNVDHGKLYQYAREAAEYVTKKELPHYDFEPMTDGRPDVALFDFTSMYAADHAARILERNGKRLMLALVGDSILEPFWPLGTGAARGFLSCMDAAWMMKKFIKGGDPLVLLAERENIFHLLPQTSPKKMVENYACYTINPTTRYPAIQEYIKPTEVTQLYDSDRVISPADKSVDKPAGAGKRKPKVPLPEQAKKVKGASDLKMKKSMLRKHRPSRFVVIKKHSTTLHSGTATPSSCLQSPTSKTESPTSPTFKLNGSTESEMQKSDLSIVDAKKPLVSFDVGNVSNQEQHVNDEQMTESANQDRARVGVTRGVKFGNVVNKTDVTSGKESSKLTPSQAGYEKHAKSEDHVSSPAAKWKRQQQTILPKDQKDKEERNRALEDRQTRGKERIQKEKKDKERQEKEKKDKERQEKEKKDKERQDKEKKDKERLEKQKKEKERREKDTKEEQKDKERLEKEKQKQQKEMEKMLEKDKKEKERAEKEKQKQQKEREKLLKKDVLEKEAAEKKRKEKEKAEKLEIEKREKESKQKELLEKHTNKQQRMETANKGQIVPIPKPKPERKIIEMEKQRNALSNDENKHSQPASNEQELHLKEEDDQLKGTIATVKSNPFVTQDVARAVAERKPSPLRKSARAKKSPVKHVSSPDRQLPGKPTAHLLGHNQMSGKGLSKARGAAYYLSKQRDSIGKESSVSSKLFEGERTGSSGHEPEDELIRRVAKVVRASSLKQLRPSVAIRRKRQSLIRHKHGRDETDLMEEDEDDNFDMSDDEYEMSPTACRMSLILEKMCDRLESSQAELTLRILGALTANVQDHPDDDTFRRVRVSSSQFQMSVWGIEEAQEFLFECGWMPFGDFIVLAVDANLSEALSILDDLIWDFQDRLMNGDAADVAELVNVSDTWKYRDGLISRIKHKMLSKSMSYTSALVEASADRLLQREDELGKFAVDKNNFSQLDPLSSEASTAQHAERASLIARQHWQQMEGSLHVRPPNAARARRTYSHGTSQCRKATYSAVVSSRQHGTMIERKEHQIDDAKAKRFLEEERRRHRLSSTSSMDTQNPSRGYRLASQVDDAFVDGDAETSNQKERLPSRTRFHLRLGSAPESGVCSPSPASETTSFYEPFNVQKAKEELQQMAAELNSKCFYKQIGHTAPITKEQNSYVERNGDQSKKQEEANERDEQRLESTVADSSSSFEETRTVTTSPIELPVTLDVVLNQNVLAEGAVSLTTAEDNRLKNQNGSDNSLKPQQVLSSKEEYDAAIKASIDARAKLAKLGAK
ncbi:myosin-2 heavy chain-like isoform X2 [Corticium candelabrum]|uniref:myosin-2 heavy chain-like isoform X2 n=1 Tax=Corticium candelabrum TaxID=121492 RepID=UPI002E257458|nr:myosin-2 heavy chain-like isoform X2 [Corticium candelabrum]